jgi:3,5-dihydroxyphenylacetyl-CoA synthase
VVGMGCNAGLNGLCTLDGWTRNNPGRAGVLLCCEINSAIYCRDDTPRDGVVNALFGDGAAALVVRAPREDGTQRGPRILGFAREMMGEQWGAMRFDWHEELHRWHFFLSKDIPYVLGANIDRPVRRLLDAHGLPQEKVRHWLLHTGGGVVIDSVKNKLGLTEHDVRHTRSVLREYGNLSSGSFLFSYQKLRREDGGRTGDYGVMITMGPGAQIETALLQW